MASRPKRVLFTLVSAVLIGMVTGCEDADSAVRAVVSGDPIGESCRSDEPDKLCLSLKYVVYRDSAGEAIIGEEKALSNLTQINNIYSACNVGFQIDQFIQAKPEQYQLPYRLASYADLDRAREVFADTGALLIVTTGTWDRTGSLGNTSANAWTAMPGGGPFGAILERPVATYANIIAHELGHYLNLNHVTDSTDLMNPVIYSSSTKLYSSQCTTLRSAVNHYWTSMKR